MNQLTINKSPQPRTVSLLGVGLAAVLLLALIAGWLAYRAWGVQQPASAPATVQTTSANMFEERYGMRVTLIGVTAAGGMVDLLFKVLDPHKAMAMLQDPHKLPRLMVQDSGTELKAPDGTLHDVKLETGQIYYILYPNTRGAIRPGSAVSVMMGDERLEPIIAQ